MKDGRIAADAIQEDLEAEGYGVCRYTLNAVDFRVPQYRERVFFFGFRDGLPRGFPGLAFQPRSREGLAVGDIMPIPLNVPDQEYLPLRGEDARCVSMIPEGGDWHDIPWDELPERLKKRLDRNAADFGMWRRRGRWEIMGTVTMEFSPGMGSASHSTENRRWSVREVARFQSFPDSFRFPRDVVPSLSKLYQMIGNAVPPVLAEHVGRAVARALEGEFLPHAPRPKPIDLPSLFA
jgi:DNA (cytosine-5)-methyltransferase 1